MKRPIDERFHTEKSNFSYNRMKGVQVEWQKGSGGGNKGFKVLQLLIL